MLDFPTVPVTAQIVPLYRSRAHAAMEAKASRTEVTSSRGQFAKPSNCASTTRAQVCGMKMPSAATSRPQLKVDDFGMTRELDSTPPSKQMLSGRQSSLCNPIQVPPDSSANIEAVGIRMVAFEFAVEPSVSRGALSFIAMPCGVCSSRSRAW